MNKLSSKLSRIFSNYFFILKTVWNAAPKYLVLLIFIALIGALLPMVPLFLMKEVMNILSSTPSMDNSKALIMLLISSGVIDFLARFNNSIRSFFSNITVAMVEKHVNLQILQKACSMDMHNVESRDYYFKLDNARRSLGRRWDDLVLAPVNLFAHCITLVSLIVILGSLRWYLVFILIAGILPNILIQIKIRDMMNNFYTSNLDENRKISYIDYLLSNKHFAKEIRLFNVGTNLLKRIENLLDSRQKKLNKLRLKELKLTGFASLLSFITISGCQILIALMVLKKEISLGHWSLYTGTLQSINFNLNVVINIISNSYEEKLFSKVLKDFLDIEPKMNLNEGIPYPKKPINTIEFRNVSFSYPDSDTMVLKNISFKVNANDKVALVGLNGSGKSTLIKLLARIYDPTEGEILYDGINIKQYKPIDFYNSFGIIFQDFCQYAFSLKDNITIGDLDKSEDLSFIDECCNIAGVSSIVKNLPDGFNTYITKDYDRSGISNLSGGQWQKIAIARGFFRDAPVVILDEPTSSLDPLAEYEIFENFVKLCHNKTTFLISHRLSSVHMSDYILFLKEGSITEVGSHEELMRKDGDYAQLFSLQAEKYQINYTA